MIGSLDVTFHRRLKAKLDEEIAARAEVLVKGHPQTFEDYRRKVGEIAGLRHALALTEMVNDELTGGARPQGEGNG